MRGYTQTISTGEMIMNRYYVSKMPGHPAFLIVLAETIHECLDFLNEHRVIYGDIFAITAG
jgi:hypothetical protein